MRFCKIKQVNNPWITADILKLINHRDFLLKKAFISKLEADFKQYQNARNHVNIAIRKVKKSFYSEKITAASSQNELWKTLRNVLPSKRDQSCNPNLSAEVFNSYFSSIGKNITKDISFNKHFVYLVVFLIEFFGLVPYLHLLLFSVCPILNQIRQLILLIWMLSCL